jgi:hypothetical protein
VTHTASVGCRGCRACPSALRPRGSSAGRGSEDPTEDGGRAGVLSIGALYDEVEAALTSTFPRNRQLWVRGEIHSFSDQSGRRATAIWTWSTPTAAGRVRSPAAGARRP